MWNDLIVIGYPAGYGGEFFSSILVSNFDAYKPIQRKSAHVNNDKLKNWYTFDGYNSIGSLKSLDSILCHCGDLIDQSNSDKVKIVSRYAKPHIDIIWDSDPKVLIENLTYVCRDHVNYYKPKIINVHYHERLRNHEIFGSFTLNDIFPGSTKFRMACSSYYHDLFTLLYVFKTNAIYENINMGNDDKDFFFECALPERRKDFIGKPFEDFIDIDVGKLFFEDDFNVDLTEQQLSSVLNKKIDLNKKEITENYKPRNINILKDILGANFMDNSEETNTQLVFDYVSTKFDEQLRLYKNSI